MIDKPKQASELMQHLKAHLPLSAKPTDWLASHLGSTGVKLTPGTELDITDVMYMGDEGGICCAAKLKDQDAGALVVSITHLRLDANHPLSPEVRAYQTARVKKLARRR